MKATELLALKGNTPQGKLVTQRLLIDPLKKTRP
jgi:hypothetical protein